MASKAPHKGPTVLGKSELIHQIASRAGLNLNETNRVIDALAEVVRENLSQGHEVRIMGFGTWNLREIAQRKVKDIQSGEWKVIPATRRVGFKVGAVLAEAAGMFRYSHTATRGR